MTDLLSRLLNEADSVAMGTNHPGTTKNLLREAAAAIASGMTDRIANSAKIAEIRVRAGEWLAGLDRIGYGRPQAARDLVVLAEIAEAAQEVVSKWPATVGQMRLDPASARLEQALSKFTDPQAHYTETEET